MGKKYKADKISIGGHTLDESRMVILDNLIEGGLHSEAGYISSFTDTNTHLTDAEIAAMGYIKTYTDTNTQLTSAEIAAMGYTGNQDLSSYHRSNGGTYSLGSGSHMNLKHTTAGGYSEVHMSNNNDEKLVFGSIGTGYTNTAWAGSRYIYSTAGELRIKAASNLRLYSGGHTHTGNLAVTFDSNQDAAFTGNISAAGFVGALTGNVTGNARGVSETGYGSDNFTFQQLSGAFAGYSGWANYYIGNHGNGSTYYNTTHIMPFWGAPKYSRLEGGTQSAVYDYWTSEGGINSDHNINAPVFYDSNDTSYYLNPASTSNLNVINATGGTSTEWNTAHGWGNHADEGYLTALPSHNHDTLYLGKTAKASDSELLDGLNSTAYMRDNGWNTSPGQDADIQPTMSSDFTYSNNAPHTGDLIRFGSSGYSLQLNSTYNDTTGGLSFRSYNNDGAKTWNPWRQVHHTGLFSTTDVANGVTAHGWGNHADAGYLTSYTDTNTQLTSAEIAAMGYLTEMPSHSHNYLYHSSSAQLADIDLDSISTSGVYQSASTYASNSNIPYANYFTMLHLDNAVGRAAQLWFGDSPGRMYYRPKQGANTWHPWEHVITSGGISQTKAGLLQSNASLRAPVFYDSNNTSYYLDPASTGTALNIQGAINVKSSHSGGNIALDYFHSSDTYSGNMVMFMSEPGITHDGGGIGNNIATNSPYYGRAINHGYGVYLRFYKTNGHFEFWNTQGNAGSAGGQGTRRFHGDASGNTFSQTSSRAPIFYDSNDTNYYLNPASTSNLNIVQAVQFQGSLAGTASNANTLDSFSSESFLRSDADDTVNAGVTYTWTRTDTAGLVFTNNSYNTKLYMGGWTTTNSNNISRIRTSSGNLHIDSAANGNTYLNWYSGGEVKTNSILQSDSSLRAPIFYDSNDTTYYTNPAGASIVKQVKLVNSSTPLVLKVNSSYKSWVHHIASNDSYVFAPSTADGGESWDWANQMSISSSGVVTANNFVLSSDKRSKTKIKDLTCDNINTNWKSFEMKGNEGDYRTGVIAQELEETHPEFVNTDPKGFKSVKYIDLLIAKIAELEARLEKLEK